MMLNSFEDMVTGIKLNKQLYNNSINEKLTKQNLQTNLTEIYKPLLTGQEQQLKETAKIKPAIVTGAREITDKLDQNAADAAQQHAEVIFAHNTADRFNYMVDLAKVTRKHPNLVAFYRGTVGAGVLTQLERTVAFQINNLPDDNLKILIAMN
jgi:hypothetical protein